MSKQTGLGDQLYVGGIDLSGDIGSVDRVGGGPAPLEVTGIDKSGIERIGGVRDGAIAFSSWFNPAAGASHDTLSALPTADVHVMYLRGEGIGSAGACCLARQITYDGTRATDGAFSFSVEAQSDGYGVEWGEQLTAGIRSDTAATNGSSLDAGAASANGLQAYLHVFSFTGTSVTVKVQQSSDNGAGDAFADVAGGSFTPVSSAPATERIATASGLAVERYLRVVTTGTFSAASFAVVVVRNATAVVF